MTAGPRAEWALWGKRPHTQDGYHVLRAHPLGRNAEYVAQILRWSPGTPGNGARLPWITLGPGTTSDGTASLGVFVLEGTNTMDGHDRPICQVSHFAVPFQEVSGRGASWAALGQAALEARGALATAAGAVELPLAPEGQLPTAGHDLTSRSFRAVQWHAALAACLLDGPVVVTGARDEYTPQQLLDVLDGVAAMLPFGMRASLSAGTCTAPGADHDLRLSWGPQDDSRASARWGTEELPDVGWLRDDSRAYLDMLLGTWQTHGGEQVLHHLAYSQDARLPLDIEAPDSARWALDLLRRLNVCRATAQRIRRHEPVQRHEVDTALAQPYTDPDSVQVLVDHKLADEGTDLGVLARHLALPAVAEKLRDRLRNELAAGQVDTARAILESLVAGGQAEQDAGGDLSMIDELLAYLIDGSGGAHESVDDSTAARLLNSLGPFPPGRMPFTHPVVQTRALLCRELLRLAYDEGATAGQEHADEQDPGARSAHVAESVRLWLDWLSDGAETAGPSAAEELPLLAALLRGDTPWAPFNPRKWAERHVEAAFSLVEIASACGGGNDALTMFGDVLYVLVARHAPAAHTGAQAEGPVSRALYRALDGAAASPLSAESRGRCDLLRVLAGLQLAGLPDRPWDDVRDFVHGYADTLQRELLRVPADRAERRRVAYQLVTGALRIHPGTGRGPGPAGRRVAEGLLANADPDIRKGATSALMSVAANSRWQTGEDDERWLDRMAEQVPPMRTALRTRRIRLAASRTDVRPDELARLLCEANQSGIQAPDLCEALRDWSSRVHTGAPLAALVDAYEECWSRLVPGKAESKADELEREIAAGCMGESAWPLYRATAEGRLDRQWHECQREIDELTQRMRGLSLRRQRLDRLNAARAPSRSWPEARGHE